jgi:hypothetical protein
VADKTIRLDNRVKLRAAEAPPKGLDESVGKELHIEDGGEEEAVTFALTSALTLALAESHAWQPNHAQRQVEPRRSASYAARQKAQALT